MDEGRGGRSWCCRVLVRLGEWVSEDGDAGASRKGEGVGSEPKEELLSRGLRVGLPWKAGCGCGRGLSVLIRGTSCWDAFGLGGTLCEARVVWGTMSGGR